MKKNTTTEKAKLLVKDKYNIGANIYEMIIWELPKKTKERPHGFKYRLYYGNKQGVCLLRYDNEQGKGDHVHYGKYERKYEFKNVEQLIKDFLDEVEKMKGE